MVKVHNWNAKGNPPDNPTANDMRFGVGCMNDRLMDLIFKMSDLFPDVVSKVKTKDVGSILEDFKGSTFGQQVAQLQKYYDGGQIIYTSMWNAVRERNYFAHEFRTSGKNDFKKVAIRLYNLLNELDTLQNQVDNAKKKVVSDTKKKSNKAKNPTIKRINEAIRQCMDDEGFARLTSLGIILSKDKSFVYRNEGEKMMDALERLGYEIFDDDYDSKIKYTCLHA